MVRYAAIAILLALAPAANSQEIRVARYDLDRVFREYQRTKDTNSEVLAKIHVGGPGSYSPAIERREKLLERIEAVTAKLGTTADGPDRERLALQLRIAQLEEKLHEAERTLQNLQRARDETAGRQRQRDAILAAIASAASGHCEETQHDIAVPYYAPPDLVAFAGVHKAQGTDITEALLARLNREYAAKKK